MDARRSARFALLLLLVVAALGLVGAQGQEPVPSAAALSVPLSDPVPVDPRITIGYLANGLRYYIRTNLRPSRRAELRLVVNVGSVVEDDDQVGLAHFLEHMAFNGSEHFAKQDLIAFMESIGMRLGPGVNADTSFDETVYALHVPTDNAEAMRKAFLFFADLAHRLSLDPATIDKERGVIVEEWRLGRGADARMQDQQFPILLKGSRYAERMPIGTRENIQKFPPEALRRFYTDWYRPDLMAVIAVGDFDKSAIERLIKEHFAGIPSPSALRPRPVFDVPGHAETLYAVATDKEATITTVTLHHKLPFRDQTTVGAYRQGQVERLYTGMLNSRLSELALRADPPFLRAGARRGLFVRTKETATLMALVREDGIERGLDALVTELVRAARFGFTPTELERERRDVLRNYEAAFAERDKEESTDLAAEFVRAFTQKEPTPGITFEYGLVRRFVPEITLDEVNQVAKEWAGGSRVVLVNAPEKPGLAVPDGAKLATVIRRASEREIKPYVDATASQRLIERPPAPGAIVSTTTRDAYGLVEWDLSNGAKVVLRPTTFKQDEVVFRAISPGGTSLARDEDFVAAMTAGQVVGGGGLGKFDVIQLRNMLSGKAASVTAFIGDTEEGLAGGASPKDLETMFQLIHLSFTQPRADATVFGVLTSQMKAMLANQEASPELAFRRTLDATLAQDHPRARPLTPAMVDEMSLQKSFAFYKDRFADASDFTFVFTGSFELASMKPLVEQYLASLPALKRRETWRDVGITPPRGIVEKVVRKGIEPKSHVDIVFTGPFAFDTRNQVVLDALTIVLETRLRETLREALGGTYGVEVDTRASKIPKGEYGITIDFGCDPSRAEELVKTVFREIEAFRTAGPSEREVRDAREALLRRHESNLALNANLAGEIAERYENGVDVAEFFGLPAHYMGLTTTAIRDGAQQYLDTKNYVRVTLYPEKFQSQSQSRSQSQSQSRSESQSQFQSQSRSESQSQSRAESPSQARSESPSQSRSESPSQARSESPSRSQSIGS